MKKVTKPLTTFLLILPLLIFFRCAGPDQKYQADSYFATPQHQDSLKADLITYVGVPPKRIGGLQRFQPKYRKHYVAFLPKYTLDRYYVADDSTHYFFMVRPARSPRPDTQRGVGGKFKKNARGSIIDFVEVYNTPILAPDELLDKGRALFEEMVQTGNLGKYTNNRDYVEWPDDRLEYDQKTYEWRYTALN